MVRNWTRAPAADMHPTDERFIKDSRDHPCLARPTATFGSYPAVFTAPLPSLVSSWRTQRPFHFTHLLHHYILRLRVSTCTFRAHDVSQAVNQTWQHAPPYPNRLSEPDDLGTTVTVRLDFSNTLPRGPNEAVEQVRHLRLASPPHTPFKPLTVVSSRSYVVRRRGNQASSTSSINLFRSLLLVS